MSTYTMSAEDNYTAALAADLDDGTLSTDLYRVEQTACGIGYDHVRRRLVYSVTHRVNTGGTTTNTRGHTIWDGRRSISVGGSWNQNADALLYIAVKDIDTGAVTYYDTYDPEATVPSSVAGDGTWRRFVREALYGGGQTPALTDPRTGDVWIHTQSCEVYCFRNADDYTQQLSPFFGVEDVGNLTFPVAITDDWVYIREDATSGELYHCVPRLLTAQETTADELLSYADYTFPEAISGDWQLRHVCDADGVVYVSFVSYDALTTSFKLYKFEPPTSAPYGGPVVGGGFTDITPWASDTGPNADGANYFSPGSSHVTGSDSTRPNAVFELRGQGVVVMLSCFVAGQWAGDGATALHAGISCTYVDVDASTFDHHSFFIEGYMSAGWQPVATSEEAAYIYRDLNEVNSYVDAQSYTFDGIAYNERWFVFLVEVKDSGGAFSGDQRRVFIKYRFASGSAPQVREIVDELSWRTLYQSYVDTYHPNDSVVVADTEWIINGVWDDGIWDAATGAFWFSGGIDQSLFYLNNAFPTRGGLGSTLSQNPPFLKMVYVPSLGHGHVYLNYGDQ